jgi:hypothetical protein
VVPSPAAPLAHFYVFSEESATTESEQQQQVPSLFGSANDALSKMQKEFLSSAR